MPDLWLKTLGLGMLRAPDDWANRPHGPRKVKLDQAVMFPHRPSVMPGDRLVYYAAGWGVIFAEGEAISVPYEDRSYVEAGRTWPWWVNVRLDHRREFIHDGVPLDAISVGRDLRRLMRRRSHIRLTRAEYDAAVRVLGGGTGHIERVILKGRRTRGVD